MQDPRIGLEPVRAGLLAKALGQLRRYDSTDAFASKPAPTVVCRGLFRGLTYIALSSITTAWAGLKRITRISCDAFMLGVKRPTQDPRIGREPVGAGLLAKALGQLRRY